MRARAEREHTERLDRASSFYFVRTQMKLSISLSAENTRIQSTRGEWPRFVLFADVLRKHKHEKNQELRNNSHFGLGGTGMSNCSLHPAPLLRRTWYRGYKSKAKQLFWQQLSFRRLSDLRV